MNNSMYYWLLEVLIIKIYNKTWTTKNINDDEDIAVENIRLISGIFKLIGLKFVIYYSVI